MKSERISGFNNIDWSVFIRQIKTMPSYVKACQQYENNLISIIEKNKVYKKTPILMLSGGVDSMMLGAVLKKHFRLQHSLTFACVKTTEDIQQSVRSAKALKITNECIEIPYDEIIANLSLAKGQEITTVNSLLYYIMFYLGLQKAKVTKVDLVNGDGADTLLGSIKSFMYIDTLRIQQKYSVSNDIAKTACKIRNYQAAYDLNRKRGKGAGHLFVQAAKNFKCNPIMAFKDRVTLEWVNRLPYSFAIGKSLLNKQLHKEFIRYMGYDNSHKRTVMQLGTGVYDKLKNYLIQTYRTNTANQAVHQIVHAR